MSKHKHKSHWYDHLLLPGGVKACLKLHEIGIPLFGTTLYGFPGTYHSQHYKALNVWLDRSNVPETLYTFNLKMPALAVEYAHLFFPVYDRKKPLNEVGYLRLVEKCLHTLKEGHEVAVSCIGGHGRTGTLLAIIFGLAHPEVTDPIEAIRSQGCDSWVESEEQAKFIFKLVNKPYLPIYDDPIFQPWSQNDLQKTYYPPISGRGGVTPLVKSNRIETNYCWRSNREFDPKP